MKRKRNRRRSRAWLLILGIAVLIAVGLFLTVRYYKPSPSVIGGETDPSDLSDTSFNFLLIGRDRVASLADVVMLVNLDTENGRLAVMQFPRDTYLTAPGTETVKINAAFAAYAKQTGDYTAAAGKLAEALSKALCIAIRNTAVIDLDSFGAAVDLLVPAGITVEIPFDMDYDDPEQNLSIHFKAGTATLHGKEAQEFVRFRSGYALADVGRVDAQKNFLSALFPAVTDGLKNASALELASLAATLLDLTDTDLGLLDAVYFARQARTVSAHSVYFMTAPGAATRNDGGSWFYQVNRDDLWALTDEYFNVLTAGGSGYFDEEYALCDLRDGACSALYFDESGKYAKVYTASGLSEAPIHITQKKGN